MKANKEREWWSDQNAGLNDNECLIHVVHAGTIGLYYILWGSRIESFSIIDIVLNFSNGNIFFFWHKIGYMLVQNAAFINIYFIGGLKFQLLFPWFPTAISFNFKKIWLLPFVFGQFTLGDRVIDYCILFGHSKPIVAIETKIT